MKIYTRQGDAGMSVLFDGRRVRKDDMRLETYGTVDELNSHLGLAAAECADPALKDLIVAVQGELLELGSDLATPVGSPNEAKVKRVGAQRAKSLEEQIDAATTELAPLKRFILPGGSVTASRLHVARTVCRRAERLLVTLMGMEGVTGLENCLVYLNRLSDLLFTWARLANKRAGVGDIEWKIS